MRVFSDSPDTENPAANFLHEGGLSLMGMSRVVSGATSLRHRIKRCDRLLGNSKLEQERHLIYGAMARRVISGIAQIGRTKSLGCSPSRRNWLP